MDEMKTKRSVLNNYFFPIYEVPHGSNATIVPLEGVRAIAAFMVFVVHYAAQFTPWIDKQSLTWLLIIDFRHIGAKGVELFFVISGFLIYGLQIRKNEPFLSYFKRRIRRLYPTFLAVLLLYVILSFLFPSESKLPDSVFDALYYLMLNVLMIPGVFPVEPIITVSWSLSYEMFFYLMVPLLVYTLNLRSWPVKSRIVFLIICSLFSLIAIASGYTNHSEMILFIAGMLLYELTLLKNKLTSDFAIPYCLFVTFVAVLLVKYFDLPYSIEMLTLYIGFFFVCLSSFNTKTLFSRFCSSRLMRCYGNMSYSYYLIHGLTLKFFFFIFEIFFPPEHQWDWILYYLFIPVFLLTWFSSTMLFVMVEKPMSLTRVAKQNLKRVKD